MTLPVIIGHSHARICHEALDPLWRPDGHTGRPTILSTLWAERPVLLLFWRHFGCSCGMDRAARLRAELDDYRAAGGQAVIIGQGEPARAARYRERQQLEVPILCDTDRASYEAFGLLQGTTAQILFDAPDPFLRCELDAGMGLSASRHGTDRALVDDPWQPARGVRDRDGRPHPTRASLQLVRGLPGSAGRHRRAPRGRRTPVAALPGVADRTSLKPPSPSSTTPPVVPATRPAHTHRSPARRAR
ncbi:MAG: redoxin domain-containing protein [Candidatus Limnocylindrales bacterium]